MIDMTREQSETLLADGRIGRLSMITVDGRPYVIPVRFLWHNAGVYMRLAHFGRKADALERDAHVCFEVDAFTPDFSDYASVLVEGLVTDVLDPVDKEEALFRFHEKYARLTGAGLPARPVTINGVALRKLIVERISGRRKEPDETLATTPLTPPVTTAVPTLPAWRKPPKRARSRS